LRKLDEGAFLEREAARRGMTLEEFLRRGIARMSNGGKPSVEEQVEKASKEAAETKAELEKYRKAEEDRRAREDHNRQIAAKEQFLHDFRNDLADAVDVNKHPILSSSEDADDILDRAMILANNYAINTGRLPNVDEVIDRLESTELKKFEAAAKARGYSKAQIEEEVELAAAEGRKPGIAAGSDDDDDEPTAVRDSSGRLGSRVVSNRQASSRGSAPRDTSKMSERELLEWAAEVLEKR
jgi:hypothetical protein